MRQQIKFQLMLNIGLLQNKSLAIDVAFVQMIRKKKTLQCLNGILVQKKQNKKKDKK